MKLQSTFLTVPPHGRPKRVLQFVGAFLFGSFPQNYYGSLFNSLAKRGYAIVAHRFPCNPLQYDHWEVALRLLQEQHSQKILHADAANAWIGHSLGCKFIILMEILSNQSKRRDIVLQSILPRPKADQLIERVNSILLDNRVSTSLIYNQPSLFMAPEISNTFRLFRSGWQFNNGQAQPTLQQTKDMVNTSTELFNLTRIISFDQDLIAEDDVEFLTDQLRRRHVSNPVEMLEGGHFGPLSVDIKALVDKIDSTLCPGLLPTSSPHNSTVLG